MAISKTLQLAMNQLIQSNPNVANQPRNKALLSTLSSGDMTNIRQTVDNLCQTYGSSLDQAGQLAMQWLNGNNQNR